MLLMTQNSFYHQIRINFLECKLSDINRILATLQSTYQIVSLLLQQAISLVKINFIKPPIS